MLILNVTKQGLAHLGVALCRVLVAPWLPGCSESKTSDAS